MEGSSDKTNQAKLCLHFDTLCGFGIAIATIELADAVTERKRTWYFMEWSPKNCSHYITHVSNQPKSSLVLFITITISFVVREFAKALAVRVATSWFRDDTSCCAGQTLCASDNSKIILEARQMHNSQLYDCKKCNCPNGLKQWIIDN